VEYGRFGWLGVLRLACRVGVARIKVLREAGAEGWWGSISGFLMGSGELNGFCVIRRFCDSIFDFELSGINSSA
jgi:hypothetical protein